MNLERRKALAEIRRWIFENNVELWFSEDEDWDTVWYTIWLHPSWWLLVDIPVYYWTVDWLVFKNKRDLLKCFRECKKQWYILFDLKY